MPSKIDYTKRYHKLIEGYDKTTSDDLKKGKFYLVSEYTSVDGKKNKYTIYKSPIIFTLFVSMKQDIVHCLKITDINPNIIKTFFDKLINEQREKLVVSGGARQFYEKNVKKMTTMNDEIYRTYKLSGIKKIYDLDMDITKLISKITEDRNIKKKIKDIEVKNK